MTILAVIPARLESSRLHNKPLQLLGGRPIIQRVWERATRLGIADRVVVATDSSAVATPLRAVGAEVVLTDPNHPSGTDRVAEVAALLRYASAEVVLNIQGDEPFVSATVLLGALDQVRHAGHPLGTVAVPASEEELSRPAVVKVVTADDGRALYFSRAAIPWLRDPEDAPLREALMLRHLGIYAYTPEALARWVSLPEHRLERVERLEQLRPLAAGIPMGVAVVGEAPEAGIDTPNDLERANARWVELQDGDPIPDIRTAGRT